VPIPRRYHLRLIRPGSRHGCLAWRMRPAERSSRTCSTSRTRRFCGVQRPVRGQIVVSPMLGGPGDVNYHPARAPSSPGSYGSVTLPEPEAILEAVYPVRRRDGRSEGRLLATWRGAPSTVDGPRQHVPILIPGERFSRVRGSWRKRSLSGWPCNTQGVTIHISPTSARVHGHASRVVRTINAIGARAWLQDTDCARECPTLRARVPRGVRAWRGNLASAYGPRLSDRSRLATPLRPHNEGDSRRFPRRYLPDDRSAQPFASILHGRWSELTIGPRSTRRPW